MPASAAALECPARLAIDQRQKNRRGCRKDLSRMPTKPLELPPNEAQAFVKDMRAFFKAKNQLKQDELASRQLHALWAFQRPREKKLRLADVKAMFVRMKDHV